MPNTCLRCGTPFGEHLHACPKCSLYNFKTMAWIGAEVKQEYLSKWKDRKTEVTQDLIENLFQLILDHYKIKPKRLKIKTGKTGLFEIKSLDIAHTNIELIYNPLTLAFYDKDEIESMLYHEAFHPLTMKTSDAIPVPESQYEELMDYLSDFTVVYSEYINYAEQSDYYRTSKAFTRVKEKEIPNYSLILTNLKHFMTTGSLPHALFAHNMLIKMLSDAIYFCVFPAETINSWADKYKANAILKFYKWITEDFTYIHSLQPIPEQIFSLTQLTGGLTLHVDSSELVLGNTILFTPDTLGFYQGRYDRTSDSHERKIIQTWIERYNSVYQ